MKTSLDNLQHDPKCDNQFDLFAEAIRGTFEMNVQMKKAPALFVCDPAVSLYDTYLNSFDDDDRQHHNCGCCLLFIERYGNLVVIDPETGEHKSAIWPEHIQSLPELYKLPALNLNRAVRQARVNGVFYTKQTVWGTPEEGGWTHFSISPRNLAAMRDREIYSPHQMMALKKQDFGTLQHGLADYKALTVKTAMSLLESESLYRSEKVIGPAKFLHDLHTKLSRASSQHIRNNLIWYAVATAPVGFATPRSSMVGTLLDDIAAGMDFKTVKARFAAKMDPLKYQRPQAAPSDGNIAQAERIIENLGLANSLKRRFARLDEMNLLWWPKAEARVEKTGRVFGHLSRKQHLSDAINMVVEAGPITWVKFARTVLPKASTISVYAAGPNDYVGVLTAVDPDAPPIFQWDSERHRNPVSWYVYHGGSQPEQWGLPSRQFIKVSGVMLRPCHWNDPEGFSQFGKRAIFILKGAEDQRQHGLSIFPETLRPELHPIRSTIEAFSKAGQLSDSDEASANGIMIGGQNPVTVRVVTENGIAQYTIDRWE